MTADFGLAVRYREHGSNENTIDPVESTDEQASVIRRLLLGRGIVAEPVRISWTVDKTVRDTTARQIVVEAAEMVLQGEITLDAGMERIRLLAPKLLSEDQVFERYDRGHDVHPDCTREARLEHLVTTVARIQGIRDGDPGCDQYDGDAEDKQYEHLVDVLAGVVEHTNDGRACERCSVVVRTVTKDVA